MDVAVFIIQTRCGCNCGAVLCKLYSEEAGCSYWRHVRFVLCEGVYQLGEVAESGVHVGIDLSTSGLKCLLFYIAVDSAV